MLLTTTSDIVRLVYSAATAVDIDIQANWADQTTTAFTPGRTNTNGTTAGGATVTIVASPAGSTQRQVKTITIRNVQATYANTITVQHYDGTTSVDVWAGTLLPSESVQYDGQKWNRLNSSGTIVTSGLTATDVQSQITSGAGVWTKPTSFTPKFVEVIMWGAGGGGGAGASLVTVSCGGAGGGGGAFNRRIFKASELGDTEDFIVGAGGTAGAPGAAGAAGGNGGIGGTTSFSANNYLRAFGGGGGIGGAISGAAGGGGGGGGQASAGAVGTTAFGVGGGPGTSAITLANPSAAGSGGPITVITTHNAMYGGAGGGGHTATPAQVVGGGSMFGGGGGGCGGGKITAGPAVNQPSAGGASNVFAAGTGGAAGVSQNAPTAGTAGNDGSSLRGGAGGGGGGSTVQAATAGAVGGAGGSHGGGGGGGGCGHNAGLGGAGGVGGIGAIYIYTY